MNYFFSTTFNITNRSPIWVIHQWRLIRYRKLRKQWFQKLLKWSYFILHLNEHEVNYTIQFRNLLHACNVFSDYVGLGSSKSSAMFYLTDKPVSCQRPLLCQHSGLTETNQRALFSHALLMLVWTRPTLQHMIFKTWTVFLLEAFTN